MNHERQELRAAFGQLADQEKELLQLHKRNDDLGLEVHNLTEQLATVSGDREELAQLKQELRNKTADVHAWRAAIELSGSTRAAKVPVSDAKADLTEANSKLLQQLEKNRELVREIAELGAQPASVDLSESATLLAPVERPT